MAGSVQSNQGWAAKVEPTQRSPKRKAAPAAPSARQAKQRSVSQRRVNLKGAAGILWGVKTFEVSHRPLNLKPWKPPSLAVISSPPWP